MAEVVVNPPSSLLGQRNAVVAGRARHYEVPFFSGPLSLKSVIHGEATWETRAGRFHVGPSAVLVLNEGEEYSMAIDALQPVETFCVFFASGFVEDVGRAAVTGSADLLDGRTVSPSLSFSERLHFGGPLTAAMSRVRESMDEQSVVALANDLVDTQVDVMARISRLPAVTMATRRELCRRVATATEFIHGHFCGPLQLADIAGAASLSPFHLHRVFTAFHRETPHAYVTRLRLARAQSLLRSTDRTVLDVALDCGFTSVPSFSERFRRTFGTPPARFRKIGKAALDPSA